ncbi:zonular occludens toxin domain-containing protein [Massilia agri]|uniref:Zonular occludens toxin n=1 Tax=Massilia agri TaxID=1886785 RepID=A0ABT2AHC6_9BURK|nr:zonular occludens toxin domain-containing protein [Massilia agri]MCS0595643.1 Zonular occludens toxin [Massilia agri]
MAINCYVGLMGTGKSYEVVSSVVVPAIRAGRRVVSNIAGLNNDAIRDYCASKYELELDQLGEVVNVTDEQVRSAEFFPDHSAAQGVPPDTIVRPGDLVAIDEAYKIWGTDEKISPAHRVFFREHRHYTHPETGVSCDLVLMTQDISDLHRSLRVVVGNSFKTHKAKGVGLDNVYTITMWEGWKQHAKYIVKDWTKTYDPEIFPLYKSYSGTKQGKEVNADSRMNIFADGRLRTKIIAFVLIGLFIIWRLGSWWWGKTHPEADKSVASAAATSALAAVPGAKAAPKPGVSSSDYSSDFRIAGSLASNGAAYVVLIGPAGVRLVPETGFGGVGFAQAGTVDGRVVTRFSGAPAGSAVEVKK